MWLRHQREAFQLARPNASAIEEPKALQHSKAASVC